MTRSPESITYSTEEHDIIRENPLASEKSLTFSSAIFFDNDRRHLKSVTEMCPTIKFIKVAETEREVSDKKWRNPMSDEKFMETFIKPRGLIENKFYNHLNELFRTSGLPLYKPQARYDELSGIQEKEYEEFITWVDENNDPKRAAIFDWDRTVTMIEYYWPLSDEAVDETKEFYPIHDSTITDEEQLLFVCGGEERLSMLRTMMYLCEQKNIEIVIVTNNVKCVDVPEFRRLFFSLLKKSEGDPGITIICSASWKGNKGQALLANKRFNNLCHSSGGRRIRKKITKKNKKKRITKKDKLNSKKRISKIKR